MEDFLTYAGYLFLIKLAKDLYELGPNGIKQAVSKDFYQLMQQIPQVREKIDQDVGPELAKIEDKIAQTRDGEKFNSLPDEGFDLQELKVELEKIKSTVPADKLYKVSGSVYVDQNDENFAKLNDFVNKASNYTNPLHPDVWPKLLEMGAQIVNSCQMLFNHPDPSKGFGWIAPGGSYAIYEAIKAYKIKYEQECNILQNAAGYVLPAAKLRGVRISSGKPNIIAPSTVHAAFEKACENFGIDLIKVPVNPTTQKANVAAMKSKITGSTLCLVGGAGSYAAGAIDDIAALGKLAEKYKIGLHVDACLGGFVAPFVVDQDKQPFDFGHVPGVTSVTMCTHKQAGGEKGSSVVLYKDYDSLGKYQIDVRLKSEIGVYATPGMGGSSSGYAIASAWAAMYSNGKNGYKQMAEKIYAIVKQVGEKIKTIKGIQVFGTNDTNVFSITADPKHDPYIPIHMVSEELHKLGWHVNDLPKGFHFCVTGVHVAKDKFVNKFITDLRIAVNEAAIRVKQDPQAKAESGSGALYGTMAKIPPGFGGAVDETAKGYYKALWSV